MIESLKDLERLLKLCRKQGVTEIKLGTVEFKLGDMPNEVSGSTTSDVADDPYKNFPTGILTPEQLMFYSSGGAPESDPTLKTEAS